VNLRGYIFLALIALVISGFIFQSRNELLMLGCVVYERLTDPPGVRTDGLCLLEYIASQDAK
jgi:hypothetical protein